MVKIIRKIIPIIVIFLFVVLFSGCLNTATQCTAVVSQSQGLDVVEFQSSYNEIPVGGSIFLTAVVQNVGNAVAKNIEATLWSYTGFSSQDDLKKTTSPLSPPDLFVCSSGDSYSFSWALQANCDPMASVMAVAIDFDYTSSGWATIEMASPTEAISTRELKGSNFPSAGPLQVVIEPIQNEPVIITPTSPAFDIRIKFRNTDDGLVGASGTGEIDAITLRAEGPCKFYDVSTGEESQTLVWNKKVTMSSRSRETMKIAHLKYVGSPDSFIRDFCRINADLYYHYKILKNTDSKIGISGTSEQMKVCRKTLDLINNSYCDESKQADTCDPGTVSGYSNYKDSCILCDGTIIHSGQARVVESTGKEWYCESGKLQVCGEFNDDENEKPHHCKVSNDEANYECKYVSSSDKYVWKWIGYYSGN